ncbi:MAG TPA: hypothetical protein VIJ14_03240, partial [Rhabdochlamydiaceae bacterium]
TTTPPANLQQQMVMVPVSELNRVANVLDELAQTLRRAANQQNSSSRGSQQQTSAPGSSALASRQLSIASANNNSVPPQQKKPRLNSSENQSDQARVLAELIGLTQARNNTAEIQEASRKANDLIKLDLYAEAYEVCAKYPGQMDDVIPYKIISGLAMQKLAQVQALRGSEGYAGSLESAKLTLEKIYSLACENKLKPLDFHLVNAVKLWNELMHGLMSLNHYEEAAQEAGKYPASSMPPHTGIPGVLAEALGARLAEARGLYSQEKYREASKALRPMIKTAYPIYWNKTTNAGFLRDPRLYLELVRLYLSATNRYFTSSLNWQKWEELKQFQLEFNSLVFPCVSNIQYIAKSAPLLVADMSITASLFGYMDQVNKMAAHVPLESLSDKTLKEAFEYHANKAKTWVDMTSIMEELPAVQQTRAEEAEKTGQDLVQRVQTDKPLYSWPLRFAAWAAMGKFEEIEKYFEQALSEVPTLIQKLTLLRFHIAILERLHQNARLIDKGKAYLERFTQAAQHSQNELPMANPLMIIDAIKESIIKAEAALGKIRQNPAVSQSAHHINRLASFATPASAGALPRQPILEPTDMARLFNLVAASQALAALSQTPAMAETSALAGREPPAAPASKKQKTSDEQ